MQEPRNAMREAIQFTLMKVRFLFVPTTGIVLHRFIYANCQSKNVLCILSPKKIQDWRLINKTKLINCHSKNYLF